MDGAKEDELKELKSLLRRFLKVTAVVPFRTADLLCTQDECLALVDKLRAASRTTKRRSKTSK
jgi:hypothetical protein